MTRIVRFGIGFVLGGLLAGSVTLLGDTESHEAGSSTTPADTTTTTAPSPTAAPFLEEGEVVFGSTVLLPRGLEVEDGVARFSYELAGLSPSLMEQDDADYQGDVLMMPESWELTTGAGAVVEATTGRNDGSARFELPAAEDTVARIELVGWRVATVFGDRVELEIVEGATGSLRSGQVTIETVLPQTTSTIVQIDHDHAGGEWGFGAPHPLDRGWRVSGMQGGGIQLVWEGDDAPDSVVIEDAGFEMRPESGRVVVMEQGDGA